MSSALDITQSVHPPRAVFLDYPLGHTTGKPHEPALQRDILLQALDALVRRLRDRLATIDSGHSYIVTVRGHGLRLDNPSA